jgi:hypothetical protein
MLTQTEAFVLTLAIEAVAAAALAQALSLAAWRCALAAAAASTLTHPLLWAVFPHAHALLGSAATPLLEATVMAVELPFYVLIARARFATAAVLSILANAASWLTGELIYALA